MPEQRATDHAKAVAEQAVTAPHGDNKPDQTAALRVRFGIDGVIHDRIPRLVEPDDGRAMCARWGGRDGGGRP